MSEVQSLLPPNASATTTAIETVMAERTEGLSGFIAPLWNVDTCPEALLPWLAWSFSVEVWDHAWPEATKRKVIRKSIAVHRVKGTRKSVEEALAAIGTRATIVEWWESDAQPSAMAGTFEIWLDLADLLVVSADLPKLLQGLRAVVDAAKPVSVHYTAHARTRVTTKAHCGAGLRAFGHVRNRADIPDAPRLSITQRLGAIARSQGHLKTPILENP
jgi:phage tail P2-like protein